MKSIDLDREYQSIIKKHKVTRIIALISSLVFMLFGFLGTVIESIPDWGSLDLHTTIMILGASFLGATIGTWNKKELLLLERMHDKLSENAKNT